MEIKEFGTEMTNYLSTYLTSIMNILMLLEEKLKEAGVKLV